MDTFLGLVSKHPCDMSCFVFSKSQRAGDIFHCAWTHFVGLVSKQPCDMSFFKSQRAGVIFPFGPHGHIFLDWFIFFGL